MTPASFLLGLWVLPHLLFLEHGLVLCYLFVLGLCSCKLLQLFDLLFVLFHLFLFSSVLLALLPPISLHMPRILLGIWLPYLDGCVEIPTEMVLEWCDVLFFLFFSLSGLLPTESHILLMPLAKKDSRDFLPQLSILNL